MEEQPYSLHGRCSSSVFVIQFASCSLHVVRSLFFCLDFFSSSLSVHHISTTEYLPKAWTIGTMQGSFMLIVAVSLTCLIGMFTEGLPCSGTSTGGSSDDVEIEDCVQALPRLHERLFRMSSEVIFPILRSPPYPSGEGENADRAPFETSKTETYATLNKGSEAEDTYWPNDSAGQHSIQIKLCCIRSPLPRS